MLRVWLAGGLRLERDGIDIPPPRSRRGRALLAWLALRPGMHARGELAGRFWPDVLDESARGSLRAALTELRGALGDAAAALVTTREAVGLVGDGVWVDVRAFASALEAGRAREAVDTCAGELLAGMDDEWVYEARGDHAERMRAALEHAAQDAEQAGDDASAIRFTRRAVALDPLAEEPTRQLIRRLAAAGDRASALAAYEQLRARLRATLGVTPSAATRALADDVRRGAASEQRPADVAPSAALDQASRVPFVGRAAELAELQKAWDEARSHRRRLVLLAGEPGTGKTLAALRFAAAAARSEGALVLIGRCSEEPLSAYEPFAEMVRHIRAALGDDGLAAVAGADAVELGRLLGDTPENGATDGDVRHRLFDALDATLAAIAGARPLLLVLDDLHWADRPTLVLLAFLMRSPRRTPALAVGTYRTTELGRRTPLTAALAQLRGDGALRHVFVGALSPADIAALADERLGAGSGARVAATVHARTGGNAFFVDEVLRGLTGEADEPIPESIRHAVAGRLGRLDGDANELIDVAAVLGLTIDLAGLEAAAALPPARTEAALDDLLAAHLLRPVAGEPHAVAFPHALVREAVYAEMNGLRRARLHRRVADALIALSQERHLEAIAHHLFEGASPADADRTIGYLARAGARAMSMLAYEDAAAWFARALELLDEPRGRNAAGLLVERGDALLRAGEPADATACFRQAAALAREIGEARLLARAALGHAGLGVSIVDVDAARVELLEEALEAIGETDAALKAQLLARLAVELYYAPSRDRSEALSELAVATARATGDARAVASALNARHVALWRPDRLGERRAVAAEMIAAARAAQDAGLELQARNWLVVDLWEAGELAAWRDEVRRHGEVAAEQRLAIYAWYTPLWAAVDAMHAGRFEEGAALAATAREAGTRAGDRNVDVFLGMLEFLPAILRHALSDEMRAFLADRVANSPAGMAYRGGYAWLLATSGHHAEAREQLAIVSANDYAGLAFDTNWLSAMGELAEAAAILGERAAAARLYDLLSPYAGRPLTSGRAVLSYGVADRHLGLLAATLGRPDAAAAHLEAGIALDAAAGMRPWVVHGRLALATVLEAAGEKDRARDVRAAAEDEAVALGLTPLLEPPAALGAR